VVLGYIAEPQLIWLISGEIPFNEIVVPRRPRLPVLTALLAEHVPPLVVRADPPRGALGRGLAGIGGFLDEVAVAELGVVAMGVEQSVSPLCRGKFGLGDRVGQPAIVGLAGELEDPARHRDGDSVGGELLHERVEPFPGRLACER